MKPVLGIARAVTRSVQLGYLDDWRVFAGLLVGEQFYSFGGRLYPESLYRDAVVALLVVRSALLMDGREGCPAFPHEYIAMGLYQ